MLTSFKYFNIRNLIKLYPAARYYIIYGERSNGKTFSALDYSLENYALNGEQFAYLRRFGEDIKKKRMVNLFSGLASQNRIEKWTKDWTSMDFSIGKFFPYKIDENGEKVTSPDNAGFAFDLNSMVHDKSLEYPRVKTIIFDEFITRYHHLPGEFTLFQNVCNTIIRMKNDVKIIMLGNTVNRYSPYFTEMGLKHIKNQKPGTTDVYKYGDSGLEVVVHYTESSAKIGGKPSDIYFAFDNPELQMITKGDWEIAIYPHLDTEILPKDIVFNFFVDFEGDMLHGEIIANDNGDNFIFLHEKTTPIKNQDDDLIYTIKPSTKSNIKMCLTRQNDPVSLYIKECVARNRIFYSTNEVGEVFRNYLKWSDSYNIKN